jgi:hypothetical protein
MHKMIKHLTVTLIFPLFMSGCQFTSEDNPNFKLSDDQKIVLMRHAEKPQDGDNLSCQGLNRSLALPKVLNEIIGIPDHIYIPSIKNDQSTKHVRMLQTITPFAVQYNLKINSEYNEDEIKKVLKEIKNKQGTILIVWSHTELPDFAKEIGIKKSMKWEKNDFDSLWVIQNNGQKTNLSVEKQSISPSEHCLTH